MTKETRELSLEEIREIVINEADEALKDPYVFKKPIENVAIIGAGPAGVSLFVYRFTLTNTIS